MGTKHAISASQRKAGSSTCDRIRCGGARNERGRWEGKSGVSFDCGVRAPGLTVENSSCDPKLWSPCRSSNNA